jgi:16S rRNA processing protein RimM
VSDKGHEDLLVGRIGGVYGVKGWVRIHSYTEPADNLFGYKDWKIQRRGQWEAIVIDEGKIHGKGLVAHIKGIDDRTGAETLKGCEISVPLSELPPLDQDDYYWHQLEGLLVVSAGEILGRLDHMLATGANDVMVVKACEGSKDDRERLIPWLRDSVVKTIDLEQGSIEVDWDAEF